MQIYSDILFETIWELYVCARSYYKVSFCIVLIYLKPLPGLKTLMEALSLHCYPNIFQNKTNPNTSTSILQDIIHWQLKKHTKKYLQKIPENQSWIPSTVLSLICSEIWIKRFKIPASQFFQSIQPGITCIVIEQWNNSLCKVCTVIF